VAPEILEGVPYGVKADMWSLGVIVYILLGGYPPFVEQNQRELFRKIRKGQFEFHEEYWGCVSSQAKDLISALLTVKSTGRLSADGTLRNAWVTEGDEILGGKDLGKNLIELRKFNGKRKFRAAIHAVSDPPTRLYIQHYFFLMPFCNGILTLVLFSCFPLFNSLCLPTSSKHSIWKPSRELLLEHFKKKEIFLCDSLYERHICIYVSCCGCCSHISKKFACFQKLEECNELRQDNNSTRTSDNKAQPSIH
jgi:serine/threonine protein kinase